MFMSMKSWSMITCMSMMSITATRTGLMFRPESRTATGTATHPCGTSIRIIRTFITATAIRIDGNHHVV
jgi:hypothetical protein